MFIYPFIYRLINIYDLRKQLEKLPVTGSNYSSFFDVKKKYIYIIQAKDPDPGVKKDPSDPNPYILYDNLMIFWIFDLITIAYLYLSTCSNHPWPIGP